jgi:hypothetical protein
MADIYVKNVLDYKIKTWKNSEKYQQKELNIIRQLTHESYFQVNHENYNSPLFEIEFDLVEPKLKLMPKVSNHSQIGMQAIKLMCKFAVDHGYFEKNNGCHICLNISSDSNHTYGYMHLSADNFYRMHPARDLFFANFQNLTSYSIDT